MLTDKELDAMLLVLRTHTAITRLNIAECRAVFRFAESQGYTIQSPATPADAGLAAALAAGSAVS